MFPVWVYAAVAMSIAAIGLVIAQFFPGMGMLFVPPATFLWIGYVQHRGRRSRPRGR